MARDEQAGAIAAVFRAVSVRPGDGAAALCNQLIHRVIGAEAVFRNDEHGASLDKGTGEKPEPRFVTGAPITTVKEHQDRSRSAATRVKDIEHLDRALPVSNVERTSKVIHRLLAVRHPALYERTEFRHSGTGVVLRIQLSLIVVAIDRCAHDVPINAVLRLYPEYNGFRPN